MLSSFSSKAKWELKNYWDDGVTIECRYFPTKKSAKDFAIANGYTSYKIVPNNPAPQRVFMW